MEKLKMHSRDMHAEQVEKLAALFPNCITETRDEKDEVRRAVDFELLRQELSGNVVEGPQERYQLNWPGKRESLLTANAPIAKTLRPCREASIEFDTTKNLYIEGDNLDVLKLLQEIYLNRVKLIYIDPPYNTGNEFIYDDDFAQDVAEYLLLSNQRNDAGCRLVANPETNGRFHSDWLSMLHPRLKLARQLLRDDGFFVASIDDAELANLKCLLDEVFGRENALATLVWDRNRKNDAKFFSVGHEYMLVYARNKAWHLEHGTELREPKPGIDEARAFFNDLRKRHASNWGAIQAEWRSYYNSLPASDERSKIGRFSKVGARGPYRDDGDISWPGGGGPRYEVLHPVTKRPCRVPARGWVYPTAERFWQEVEAGRVVFGEDETTSPGVARYLFESDGQVMQSVFYSYAQTAAVEFRELMGTKVFDNPKNWRDMQRLVRYLTSDDDIILDFFSGSGSTAHAVMSQNAEDGHKRRFIAVQLPEECDEGTEARSAGYLTIAELGRDRLRRAGDQIKESTTAPADLDVGFRVLKVDTSNMKDVYYQPDRVKQTDLLGFVNNVHEDRTSEDLLFQVLLDWGVDLSLPIVSETIQGRTVHFVDGNAVAACFEIGVDEKFVKAIAARKPLRAVFRDSSFEDDSMKINAEQIFKLLSPGTELKAI